MFFFESIAVDKSAQQKQLGTKLILEAIKYAIDHDYKYLITDCVSKSGRKLANKIGLVPF